mmetsp:Transcript_36604/g.117664  ORF Transcript_36604/g.117664 Transcript_36604/m.117664 type:complete len:302 (-) Transcript_36604:56-961(-)
MDASASTEAPEHGWGHPGVRQPAPPPHTRKSPQGAASLGSVASVMLAANRPMRGGGASSSSGTKKRPGRLHDDTGGRVEEFDPWPDSAGHGSGSGSGGGGGVSGGGVRDRMLQATETPPGTASAHLLEAHLAMPRQSSTPASGGSRSGDRPQSSGMIVGVDDLDCWTSGQSKVLSPSLLPDLNLRRRNSGTASTPNLHGGGGGGGGGGDAACGLAGVALGGLRSHHGLGAGHLAGRSSDPPSSWSGFSSGLDRPPSRAGMQPMQRAGNGARTGLGGCRSTPLLLAANATLTGEGPGGMMRP